MLLENSFMLLIPILTLHLQLACALASSMCTCFMIRAQALQLKATLRVFRYLKHTINLCLLYHWWQKVVPHGYSDSNYQGDLDEKKSTFDYIFSLGTMPTSWKSKLQAEVAQSSVEAKYRAMNKASRKLNWYRNILGEIGFPCEKPSTLYCDN